MNSRLKKILLSTLKAITNRFDHSPFLQSVSRHLPLWRKTSVVCRLSRYPKNVTAKCLNITYQLNLTDLLQREIYFNCYDGKQLAKLLRHIVPGGVYIDVGANVGFYSLHIAKKIQGNGKIYSFEADPILHKRLDANCSLNRFGRTIKTYNLAITNCEKIVPFYVHGEGASGQGSLIHHPALTGKVVEVRGMTLDRFLKEERLEKVSFIKIDIEGGEFELLNGAKRALTEQRFEKIYIEFNGTLQLQRGKTFKDFLQLFADYGYHPQDLNRKLLMKLQSGKISPEKIVTDFLFSTERSMSDCF